MYAIISTDVHDRSSSIRPVVPNLLSVRFGDEIRRRRTARGWTLEEMAQRCGLSPRYLSSLERNQRDPSLSTIVAVSRSLGAEPGDLLGGMKGVSPAGLEAAKLFSALSVDSQSVILQLMRLLGRR